MQGRRADRFEKWVMTGAWFVIAGPAAGQTPAGIRAAQAPTFNVTEGDYVAKDFKFVSGESLPELRLHHRTLGKPARGPDGRVTNAVLILHGTGGSGRGFLGPQFGGILFGPGQLLDAEKFFIILPDGIGHGESSKPSNGMHARFPQYDYDDMVRAQHLLLTEGLGVNHLRLILGTSMGCMHSWVWGETFPEFMNALMPLACLPVQIAGRNRMMRKMAMDAVRTDPAWDNGDYTSPPPGLKTALYILLIMGSAPLQMQKNYPTRDAADKYLDDYVRGRMQNTDANDFLYALNASRNYNPQPGLEKIRARVTALNFADDLINPPELGVAEREISRVKGAKFILWPITDETRGHGTHSLPRLWQQHLAELLAATQK